MMVSVIFDASISVWIIMLEAVYMAVFVKIYKYD